MEEAVAAMEEAIMVEETVVEGQPKECIWALLDSMTT